MQTIAGPGTHRVALDPNPMIQKSIEDNMDPAIAVERLIIQKQALETQNQQNQTQIEALKNELTEAKVFVEQFEPYKDILADKRSFLPVYLRDRVIFKQLLVKLRDIYGRQTDINADTKAGRKSAHRIIDTAVEVIIQNALLRWHEVKGRIEGEDYAARQ